MVQYRRQAYSTCTERARDYWELDCHTHTSVLQAITTLKKRNIPFKTSWRKAALLDVLMRSDRGLCSYDRYSVQELRLFCQSRGISLSTEEKTKNKLKANVIGALEQADEDATFSRFLDLPLELRLQVYAHHFESFKQNTTVVQPPITATCRLLRAESLPLFYSGHRFLLQAQQKHRYEHPVSESDLRHVGITPAVIQGLSDACLANIRKLRIRVAYWRGTHSLVECDIDFGGERSEARIDACRMRKGYAVYRSRDDAQQIIANLLDVLHDMYKQGEGRALQRGDIDALFRATWLSI